MKPLKEIACLFILLLGTYSCAVQQNQTAYNQDESVDFQVLYDELSPYGAWVDYSNYGYVWIPDVRREFAPYSTNGHWVMTDYGWTWASDYRWGWAPFHYGRWDYDDYYGWFWVPDNQWGPAWVSWRAGDGYYGWAPLRPGMSINDSFHDGYRDINRWHFVKDSDFGRRDLNRYYINRGNYTTIINNSTVINNTTVDRRRNATYIAGPPEDNVQRATGRRINRVRIQDNQTPGEKLGNEELKIYRPQVVQRNDRQSAPTKVATRQDVKPVRERGLGNTRNDVSPMDNPNKPRQTTPDGQAERRRTDPQQPIEKNSEIRQTQPMQPDVKPDEGQYPRNRGRITKRERINNPQNNGQDQQIQQNNMGQPKQNTVSQPSSAERERILQEQTEKQDRTRQEQLIKQQQLEIQKQQRQVDKQQQQIERQQQMQRRKQERQELKQQQQTQKSQQVPQTQPTQQQNEQEKNATVPSGSRRR